MAEEPKNPWTNPAENGATFPPTQVSTDHKNDYLTWSNESGGWRKLLAAVRGGAAVETNSGKETAAALVNAQSLADAAVAFQQTAETLQWLETFLQDQSRAIAGKDKAWQGPAAEAFLKQIELLAGWVGAQAERISGAAGTGGVNSVPNQLYKSAEYLVWAQNAMSYLDSAWATVAANGGTHQNANGFVAITGTPYEKPMTEQMTKVVGQLADQYDFTYSAVTPPDSSTAPPNPKDVAPPNLKPPVTPPVTPPVKPPVTPPVTPPVKLPVTPPVTPPVKLPVTPPVTPPVKLPVTPPVTPPVKLPVTPPVTPPVKLPVTPPVTPPVKLPVTPTRPGSGTPSTGPGGGFKPPVIPSAPGGGGNSGGGGSGGGVKPPTLPTPSGGAGSPFHPSLGKGVDIPDVKSPGAGGSFPGSGGMPMTPGVPGAGGAGSSTDTPDANGLVKGDASDWEPGAGGAGVPDGSAGALPGGSNLALSPPNGSFPGGGGMPMTPGAPGAGGAGSSTDTPDANGLVQGDAADWQSDVGVPEVSAGAVPGGIGLSRSVPSTATAANTTGSGPMMPGGLPNAGRPDGGEATKPDAAGLVEADPVDWAATDLTVDVPGALEGVEAGGAQLGIPVAFASATPVTPAPVRGTAPVAAPRWGTEPVTEPTPVVVLTPGAALGAEPVATPTPVRAVPSAGIVAALSGEIDERAPLDRPEAAELLHSDPATWGDEQPGDAVTPGDDYVPVVSTGDDDMSGWDDMSGSGWLAGALDDPGTRED